MKICVITANYPHLHNPVEGIFIKEQAYALSQQHQVNLFIFKNESKNKTLIPRIHLTKMTDLSLNIHHLNISKTLPVFNQLNYLIISLIVLMKIMRNNAFDIYHCHYTYPAGVIGFFIKLFYKKPYVITEHAGVFESHFRSYIHKKLSLLAFKNADTVISVSHKAAFRIKDFSHKKIIVIHNFFDETVFLPDKNHIRKTNLHIGFVGNFYNHNKGLDILLTALSRCQFKYKVHIVGGGIFFNHYISLAGDLSIIENCHFYGSQKPEDLPAFYHQLDLFVLSSRNESFGIVLIEALACGIPAIASKCGGPEEIMTSDTGLLIENDSVEALYEALNYMEQHLAEYNQDKIRQYAVEFFSKKKYLKEINQLFQILVNQK
ncbi:MAG TPA: glycosyltransferase [Candidatus Cloacimonadota bacterium]|nr:glycosyltransferase [Candidatus Cloacimonadota bacterium]